MLLAVVAAFVACADASAATPAEQQLADRYAPVVALKHRRLCGRGEAYSSTSTRSAGASTSSAGTSGA